MQASFKKLFTLIITINFFFVSTLYSAQNQNNQTQSSTEIKSVQSRVYEDPYKVFFEVYWAALQNNKFKVYFTDYGSGSN